MLLQEFGRSMPAFVKQLFILAARLLRRSAMYSSPPPRDIPIAMLLRASFGAKQPSLQRQVTPINNTPIIP